MQAPPTTTLAERLVLARTEAGLLQEEVARIIGMAQPSYSALETGKSLKTTKVGSLARLYRVDAYWLETGYGEMRQSRGIGEEPPPLYLYTAAPMDEAKSPDERRLLRAYRALTEAQRKGLLALLGKGEPE